MATKKTERKYEVQLSNLCGTCTSELFSKMAKRGDLAPQKVGDMVGTVVKIFGYADAYIQTNDTDFNVHYFDTDNGIISTGSDIFSDSVCDYLADGVDTFRICSIKTKKGKSFKAVPVLNQTSADDVEELPFSVD